MRRGSNTVTSGRCWRTKDRCRRILQRRKTCISWPAQLARYCGIRVNAAMRGGSVIILLGITALAAYSVGRQDAPANHPPAASATIAGSTAQPVAFTIATVEQATPAPQSTQQKPASDTSAKPESKRKVEAVLTAAAIAAIIVQASRNEYYAAGHPCACPNDRARNGSACGARSAYSRPGGAAPLCYPTDVTTAMIESYRQRRASR
jgi:hypothetical protein